jgi:GNAT superfamily N-acetyltransferase
MTFSIQEATKQDIQLIFKFIKDLAAYEKLSHSVITTEDILAESLFPENGGHPGAHVVFAYQGEKAVGMALYFYNFSTFTGRPGLYLEDLFVQPECRGHGVGSFFFSYLARKALEMKCTRFEWAVLDWNQTARDFYKKMGAKEGTEWILNRVDGDALVALANKGL